MRHRSDHKGHPQIVQHGPRRKQSDAYCSTTAASGMATDKRVLSAPHGRQNKEATVSQRWCHVPLSLTNTASSACSGRSSNSSSSVHRKPTANQKLRGPYSSKPAAVLIVAEELRATVFRAIRGQAELAALPRRRPWRKPCESYASWRSWSGGPPSAPSGAGRTGCASRARFQARDGKMGRTRREKHT